MRTFSINTMIREPHNGHPESMEQVVKENKTVGEHKDKRYYEFRSKKEEVDENGNRTWSF